MYWLQTLNQTLLHQMLELCYKKGWMIRLSHETVNPNSHMIGHLTTAGMAGLLTCTYQLSMEISLAQKSSRSHDATLLNATHSYFSATRKFPIEKHLFFIQDNPGHILHQQRQLNEKISSMKWMVDSDDAVAMHSSSQFPACYDKSPINYISYAWICFSRSRQLIPRK